ncbi:uncharacterized protein TrAFT101_006073 [Trichoderma asperellum]|uniref:Uncharacterized protein n=1 Tax=Trichoderma asperellum (strain ATCC 204424 / CBS 433.97 / NBRC 101777) TaxID=1042311 RepID=A0A2T3Z7Y9_TRIA4|nr:hypothetical protein M441DRAFT_27434 [Trichoderma asperellum CBS 433.97]PTB40924.1 hypothetical protein M441DRAFT_27434 [Trichoderma asperellum CBS 433.97]UKZ91077.1 hypothetical protein TrAFT101_006073 [Trichoderma asperellum]
MSATVITRTAAKTVARRPVSFVMQIRRMGRAFEHHPYERIPVTAKPAAPDYMKEVTWVAGKIVTYVPTFGLMLGWPALCKWALDGQIGRL